MLLYNYVILILLCLLKVQIELQDNLSFPESHHRDLNRQELTLTRKLLDSFSSCVATGRSYKFKRFSILAILDPRCWRPSGEVKKHLDSRNGFFQKSNSNSKRAFASKPVQRTIKEHKQTLVGDVGPGRGKVPAVLAEQAAVLVDVQQREILPCLVMAYIHQEFVTILHTLGR